MAHLDPLCDPNAPRAPEKCKEIDDRDKGTPDDWVPRHPDLQRLTGRHPFNVEPLLKDLYRHGFHTPASLHFVRNHGPVPIKAPTEADREEVYNSWRVKIHGAVEKEVTVSIADLEALPRVVRPCLLVCAGNRRKEQNTVKKTIGFNWGAAGLSCSTWEGCRLIDVLALAGIKPKAEGAKHVHFTGPPGELPKGEDGSYGTSLKREYALNPDNDVLLVWKQNGERLAPDHGFPLRLLIPGFIGGRMIKWLQDIKVDEEESPNFYHYRDNRVLPVGVTPESAEEEGWWFKPDYIINELNINSAIAKPNHGEVIALDGTKATYPMRGYAYSGGGRKVHRVEISFDGGVNWTGVDTIDQHPDAPTDAGKYWCYCFWEYEAPLADLVRCAEVMVRAWDVSMNTQPAYLTWNVMGMLNNPWFRVRVHCSTAPTGAGGALQCCLTFEHPTMAGAVPGGWMTDESTLGIKGPLDHGGGSMPRLDSAGAGAGAGARLSAPADRALALSILSASGLAVPVSPVAAMTSALPAPPAAKPAAKPTGAAPPPAGARLISRSEMASHDKEDDVWIAVKGKVYDCTKYLKDHPGGIDSITMNAGEDTTEEFEAIHSPKAWKALEPWYIGELVEDDHPGLKGQAGPTKVPEAAPELATGKITSAVALNPKKRVPLTLVRREEINDTVRLWRFQLPDPEMVLGLPCGKHFLVYARVAEPAAAEDGASAAPEATTKTLCVRAYTPVSADELKGHVDMLVRVYRPLPPRFPRGGIMSQHFDSLVLGDTIEVRGPIGEIEYLGDGAFKHQEHGRFVANSALFIGGGTGITPLYSVIRSALTLGYDGANTALTKMSLVYGNSDTANILCRKELDAWALDYKERFSLWYTVDQPPPADEKWDYSVGFIDTEMLRTRAPTDAPGPADYAFLCGPPPMVNACKKTLNKIGYADDHILCF